MATQGRNWLIGCGVGCLAVVVGLVLLVGGGALLFRQAASGWDEAASVRETLHDRYGPTTAFTPVLEGALDVGRLEAFLRVRGGTDRARAELAEALEEALGRLEGASGKLDRLWGLIRSGSSISPLLAEFSRRRSEALLAEDLGPGQYLYLYSLIHHCWLGRDPAAGIEGFARALARGDGSFEVTIDGRTFQGEDVEDLDRQVRRDLNEHHRRWLAGLLRDAESAPADRAGRTGMIDRLQQEIERLERDRQALPWRDGLPSEWARRLEPYRAAFQAGWHPLGDLVEVLDTP